VEVPAVVTIPAINMANQDNNDGGEERQLTEAEAAIIEFMKQKAALEARGGNAAAEEEQTEHKFWDTQVRAGVNGYSLC